jgi:hypothetical protein
MATCRLSFFFAAMLVANAALSPTASVAGELPDVDSLPSVAELPDPLKMFDGTPVETKEQWETRRKPELKTLFQHYMYGYLPEAPQVTATKVSEHSDLFGGKATMKQVTLSFGPPDCPKTHLLLFVPKNSKPGERVPVVLGLNFTGNHTVLNDKRIALAEGWFRDGPGVVDHAATEAGRGTSADRWSIERCIDRGYAVATFYYGDILPDQPDLSGGVLPYFREAGVKEHGPTDMHAIAAWAWGLHRGVDYLITDGAIDPKQIVVFGHSRNGKAALLAGAFDDRIAAVIPHQAGCGGTAPSRRHNPKGESVTIINKNFPHWFNANFKKFGGREEKLPFDQHCLVALCAPRPVLLSNGDEDQWADPPGQFDVLRAASPVYRLLGVTGLPNELKEPVASKLIGEELCYYVDPSKHTVDEHYWDLFLDFSDKALGKRRP